ncbi:VanZ family protein [Brevibacillus migulae]|uniref:VanZ family protein n=1 Tax=Brevibacillus migulae TaxID=1644114 RepID=UPI00106DDC24|nr:VanZ family protein [Brevibacillus migulae]
MRRISLYIDLLLVILVIAGLYYSSAQPYQKQDIRGSIERHLGGSPLEQQMDDFSLHYAGKEISTNTVGFAGFVEFFIRKATHFVTFGCLAVFLYRLLRHVCSPATAIPWSGFIGTVVAALDEWHQTFTEGRTGMVADVLLDASGISAGLIIIAIVCAVYHTTGRRNGHNRHRSQRV